MVLCLISTSVQQGYVCRDRRTGHPDGAVCTGTYRVKKLPLEDVTE